MHDLTAQIRAALDEDERAALSTRDADQPWSVEPFQPTEPGGLPGSTWVVNGADGDNGIAVVQGSYRANHIVRHDPARVLRQVAAMRKILDLHKPGPPIDYPGRDDVVLRAKTVCSNCGPHGNDSALYMLEGADDPTIWYPCDTILALAEAYGIEP